VQESRQGLLRMLAQMGERRTEVAPEIPTFREAGFDVVEGSMRGLAAPPACRPRCWNGCRWRWTAWCRTLISR
jgi:tripartite-type tricarboxylate transporter receptor subunit TctC